MTQLTAEQLKPCPYCGGHALRKGDPGKLNEPFGLIVDHTPGCFLTLRGFESDEAYDAAWNTRATPDPIAALLAPDEALRRIAAGISRDVAEWPDRNSPEDQPDMLLITQDELEGVVLDALIAAGQELAKRKENE